MAFKQFALDELTTVTIYKRKSSRSLRLSVTAEGNIRVSIPTWAPYQAGLTFAKSRQQWIAAQLPQTRLLHSGDAIGKAHHVRFEVAAGKKIVTSRIKQSEIVIKYPTNLQVTSQLVQRRAQAACIRALRAE